MNELTVQRIQAAWQDMPHPEGQTGFEYEDTDISEALKKSNIHELTANLDAYEKYYVMSYLTIEWACFVCGGFLCYAIERWFSDKGGTAPIDDPLAETFLYFLAGLRWPVGEITERLTREQIDCIVCFLEKLLESRDRIDVLGKTLQKLDSAFGEWESFAGQHEHDE